MNTRFFARRWALVVLSACASGVLAGTVFYLFRPSPVQRLQRYLGQDLRALSEDEQIKFDGLIGRLAPEARVYRRPTPPGTGDPKAWWDSLTARPSAFFSPQSWHLWRVANEQGRDRLVLFQGMPLRMIPGRSYARIFVFDVEGNPLTKCEFGTGWRITIDDARWLEDSAHGFPCLLVCSSPCINGGDITSQYYAFLQDTFALVRLEDSAGRLVPVNYDRPGDTIGPPVPQRTAEEWEAALRSPDRAEVLRTLVWFGGRHSDPPLRDQAIHVEPLEDAARTRETHARPGVRSAVEVLTRSEDRWVREAAQHAGKAVSDGGR